MSGLTIEKVTPSDLQTLLDDNHVKVSPLQPKLVATGAGGFIKFFYDEPGLHWSSFYPKAIQFTKNAQALIGFGFVAPDVRRLARCREQKAWFVVYQRLPGNDLRSLNDSSHLQSLAAFMAQLHQRGVYFRGIHLGNVLFDKGTFGLIDIAGLRVWPMPLTIWQRLRNIGRFVSFAEDVKVFNEYGPERFCQEYCEAAHLHGWRRAWLTRAVLARVAIATRRSS